MASAAEQPLAPDGKVEAAEAPADPANAGLRREPEIQPHEAIASETPPGRASREFDDPYDEGDGDQDVGRARVLQDRAMRGLARQVSMDPADGMEL